MTILQFRNWAETGITVTRDDNSTVDMTLLRGDTTEGASLHIALYTPQAQLTGDATQELALPLSEARQLRAMLNRSDVLALLDGPEDAA